MGSDNSSNEKEEDLKLKYTHTNSCDGLGIASNKPHRQRLNSDPQQFPSDNEKLQPIRRHSNYSETNNFAFTNQHSSLPNFPNKNKDPNTPTFFERTEKRRLSMKYCSDFKKAYSKQGSSTFLNHLAINLNHNQNEEKPDFEKIRKYYVPQYLFDWRYVEDPKTGIKCWKNFGKIIIDANMFHKIGKLAETHIGASEPFYIKRSWLFSYLKNRYGKSSQENPVISVNRNNIFVDSYNQFIRTKGLNLTRPLKIRFNNETNSDQEGAYREWYSLMFQDIKSPKNKLFIMNPYKSFEPNTVLFYPKYPGMKFEYYDFIGILIVKAICDLMVIRSIKINRVLLKAISKRPITLDDIKYYNLDLYQQLKFINDNQISLNPQLQQIRFVWNIMGPNNIKQEIEIVPGGKNIFLNDNNKFSFIDKVIYTEAIKPYEEHILHVQKGLHSIFDTVLEGIFSVEELQFLISGQDNIDINDWKENTIYKGCYNPDHPVIKMFWEKIGSMQKMEIVKFLKFSTGSGSVPIDGFGSLKGIGGMIQKFTIEPFTNYSAENPDEYVFHKIEAKRCHHTIILPLYRNKSELDKAINIILSNN